MKLKQLAEGILSSSPNPPTSIGASLKATGKFRNIATYGPDAGTYYGALGWDSQTSIVSWRGCPEIFKDHNSQKGTISLANTNIATLEGCLIKEAHYVSLVNGQSWNFHGIQQHILNCLELELDSNGSNMLGALLVKGLQTIRVRTDKRVGTAEDFKLSEILQKHLATGDINACQEEMIDAGFTKQARL